MLLVGRVAHRDAGARLLESLALGVPVVSTAVLGTKEVLENAAGAIVVDEDVEQHWSSREMARRLLAL